MVLKSYKWEKKLKVKSKNCTQTDTDALSVSFGLFKL